MKQGPETSIQSMPIGFREAHIRVAVINTAATANPISREINLPPIEVEAVAGALHK